MKNEKNKNDEKIKTFEQAINKLYESVEFKDLYEKTLTREFNLKDEPSMLFALKKCVSELENS